MYEKKLFLFRCVTRFWLLASIKVLKVLKHVQNVEIYI